MKETQKYYLVEASALPEVFLKVAEAKRLLSTGKPPRSTKLPGLRASAAALFINIGTWCCLFRI